MEDILRSTRMPRTKEQKLDTFRMLLQAALTNVPSSPSASSPGSSKDNRTRQINGESDPLSEKEVKELRAIKRLMEIKGYESMMKFLES